ncbi:hypothetical protein [Bradyrhizobium sp. LeoA1S1]
MKVFRCLFIAAAAIAALSGAQAADVAVKAVKRVTDLPFFFVIDDRVTFSYLPTATDPGYFSRRPDGSINGKTAKQFYSFTHFDAWAYGTNFINIYMSKSDHNDPAMPCTAAYTTITGGYATCAGATEVYANIRSTFGWNQIFDTKAFSVGLLHNISFEVGVDALINNTFVAPSKRGFVAGLQFAFDLPYKGYFNIAPLYYKEINHNSFTQCGLFGPGVPAVTCLADGNTNKKGTWAVETNYYMDLGFLPPSMQFFSISGRAAWYGPKGNQSEPLAGLGVGPFSTATKVEFNSEPIRLTFDASKAFAGPKYSHLVDVWVAYRYWQNKFGLDHNAAPGACTLTVAGVTTSTNTCTESSLYSGITLKF